jgi:hypothetical protein
LTALPRSGTLSLFAEAIMHRRAIVLGAAAVAALAACTRQQNAETEAPPAPDPAAVVRAIYEPYLTEGAQFPDFRDQAPWSADLWRQLEAMTERSNALNAPILDFDPAIDAQDAELTNLNIATDSVVENSHATVRATFTNMGRPTEIVYDLIWENGGWRVDNIRTSAWDLRRIAAQ